MVTQAKNRFYLSGFEESDPQCDETSGWLLIRAKGPDLLLTDARFRDAAARLWPAGDVFIYGADRHVRIAAFIKSLGLSRVAFEPRSLSFADHAALSAHLGLDPSQNLVEELRLIKEPDEIEALRRSCALNQAVFDRVPELLAVGRTEIDIAWDIERLFRQGGASELSFSPIVAVGPNAALPHAIPGRDAVTDGCPVLVDVGGRLDGYCSDQTRTYWVGDRPSEDFSRTMELVRQAQERAMAGIGPGVFFREAYHLARDHFQAHGVAEAFTHSLGHGIGLATHEAPSLGPSTQGAFEPGMVVTVEPGLYYPQWGGVRWEYMVLVTEDGCSRL